MPFKPDGGIDRAAGGLPLRLRILLLSTRCLPRRSGERQDIMGFSRCDDRATSAIN
jgi:hypothetical protein